MRRFEKILLVTGASSDVGMELIGSIYNEYSLIYAQYFHMSDSFKNLTHRVEKNVEIIPIQADFSDALNIDAMIDKIIHVGKLPNNIVHLSAPKAYNKQFHKDNWENYFWGWEVSVHSIVNICRAFIPNMIKRKYGRILFMLTKYTTDNPAKFQSGYTTIKYALMGLMRSLAVEYIDRGITVNGVSPGMMETKFLSDIPEMIVKMNAEDNPLKRNLCIQEVIPTIKYILSDDGAAITGQNIEISGGLDGVRNEFFTGCKGD